MQQTPQIQLTAVVAAAAVKPARLNQVEASKAAAGQVLSISACCRQLHAAGAAASVCVRSGKLTNISAADLNPVSLRKKIRELRETGQLVEPEPEPGEGGGHAAERPQRRKLQLQPSASAQDMESADQERTESQQDAAEGSETA